MSLASVIERSKRDRETWKYTSLASLESQKFMPAVAPKISSSMKLPSIVKDTKELHQIVFVNGVWRPELSQMERGLVSTMRDYVAFCHMLLSGGQLEGQRILGRKTLELMTRNHFPHGATLADMAIGGFGEAGFDGELRIPNASDSREPRPIGARDMG